MIDTGMGIETGISVEIDAMAAKAGAAEAVEAFDSIGEAAEVSSVKAQAAVRGISGSLLDLKTILLGFGIGELIKNIFDAGLQFQNLMATMTAATGSADHAAYEFNYVREQALKMGLEVYASADAFSRLAAAASNGPLQGQSVRDIFRGFGEAASALRLNPEQTKNMWDGVARLIGMSQGGISLQLRQVREMQRSVRDILSVAKEVEPNFQQEARKGTLNGNEFLPKLAEGLHEKYQAAAQEAVSSTQGLINQIKSAWKDLLVDLDSGDFGKVINDTLKEILGILKSDDFRQGMAQFATVLAVGVKLAAEAFVLLSKNMDLVLLAGGSLVALKLGVWFKSLVQDAKELAQWLGIVKVAEEAAAATSVGSKLTSAVLPEVSDASKIAAQLQLAKDAETGMFADVAGNLFTGEALEKMKQDAAAAGMTVQQVFADSVQSGLAPGMTAVDLYALSDARKAAGGAGAATDAVAIGSGLATVEQAKGLEAEAEAATKAGQAVEDLGVKQSRLAYFAYSAKLRAAEQRAELAAELPLFQNLAPAVAKDAAQMELFAIEAGNVAQMEKAVFPAAAATATALEAEGAGAVAASKGFLALLAGGIVNGIKTLVSALWSGVTALAAWVVANPFTAIAAALAGLLLLLYIYRDTQVDILGRQGEIKDYWYILKTVVGDVVGEIKKVWNEFFDWIEGKFAGMSAVVKSLTSVGNKPGDDPLHDWLEKTIGFNSQDLQQKAFGNTFNGYFGGVVDRAIAARKAAEAHFNSQRPAGSPTPNGPADKGLQGKPQPDNPADKAIDKLNEELRYVGSETALYADYSGQIDILRQKTVEFTAAKEAEQKITSLGSKVTKEQAGIIRSVYLAIEQTKATLADYKNLSEQTFKADQAKQWGEATIQAMDQGEAAMSRVATQQKIANELLQHGTFLREQDRQALSQAIALQDQMAEREKYHQEAIQEKEALDPLFALSRETEHLNLVNQDGVLSVREMSYAYQELQDKADSAIINILEHQQDANSGILAGMMKLAQEGEYQSKLISDAFQSAFKDAENALVKFLDTGKFSMKDFAQQIQHDIDTYVVKSMEHSLLDGVLGKNGEPGILEKIFGKNPIIEDMKRASNAGRKPLGNDSDPLTVKIWGQTQAWDSATANTGFVVPGMADILNGGERPDQTPGFSNIDLIGSVLKQQGGDIGNTWGQQGQKTGQVWQEQAQVFGNSMQRVTATMLSLLGSAGGARSGIGGILGSVLPTILNGLFGGEALTKFMNGGASVEKTPGFSNIDLIGSVLKQQGSAWDQQGQKTGAVWQEQAQVFGNSMQRVTATMLAMMGSTGTRSSALDDMLPKILGGLFGGGAVTDFVNGGAPVAQTLSFSGIDLITGVKPPIGNSATDIGNSVTSIGNFSGIDLIGSVLKQQSSDVGNTWSQQGQKTGAAWQEQAQLFGKSMQAATKGSPASEAQNGIVKILGSLFGGAAPGLTDFVNGGARVDQTPGFGNIDLIGSVLKQQGSDVGNTWDQQGQKTGSVWQEQAHVFGNSMQQVTATMLALLGSAGGTRGGGIGGILSSVIPILGGLLGGGAFGAPGSVPISEIPSPLSGINLNPTGFAQGGVMTSFGPMPLRKYSLGGVATTPQVAMFGEGSMPEAYVPMPDGRSIPVRVSGAGPQQIIHNELHVHGVQNIDGFRRSQDQIFNKMQKATARAINRNG